jgi:hypothetical protein
MITASTPTPIAAAMVIRPLLIRTTSSRISVRASRISSRTMPMPSRMVPRIRSGIDS